MTDFYMNIETGSVATKKEWLDDYEAYIIENESFSLTQWEECLMQVERNDNGEWIEVK